MPALDHERPWRHQIRQLGVVRGVPHVPLEDLILAGEDVAVAVVHRGVFQHPLVEVGRADGQAVVLDERRHPHRGLASVREPVEGDPLRIDCREPLQEFERLLVLRNDVAEEAALQRVAFALQRAEAILTTVGVLRRVGDEAAIRQFVREGRVGAEPLPVSCESVHRHALEAVLTDHHRPLLARPHVLGEQQDSARNHVGIDVEDDLVGGVPRFVEYLAGPRVQRHRGRRQPADQLVVDHLPVWLDRFLPVVQGCAARLAPQFVPHTGASTQESLGKVHQFPHLPLEPDVGVEPLEHRLRG